MTDRAATASRPTTHSGVDVSLRVNAKERWVAAALCAVTFVLSWLYFFPSPYFLDSFGYVAWIEKWRHTGELVSSYRYANTVLYYWPVVMFGELGLKVVGVCITTALAGAYYFMVRRDFSSNAALAGTILFLTAPPTVITATHLKEDLTSLLFFTCCVLLIQPKSGTLRMLGVGVAYGLALLFKEVTLGAAPFVVAYTHVHGESLLTYRDCLEWRALRSTTWRALTIAAGVCLTVMIVSPTRFQDYTMMASSPYMGQFLGLWSPIQAQGLRYWAEALLFLHPWYLFPISFFVAGIGRRSPRQDLYLAIAVVLLFFLANVTVVRMRHYIPVLYFLAPVLYEGTKSMIELASEALGVRQWRTALASTLTLCITSAVAIAHLTYVYPTVDYRLRYTPSRGFYAPLSRALPADAMLLGMDNCPIAEYESGLPCENHRPDLRREAAESYAETVAEKLAQRPIYLLPDFFDYDARGQVRRVFESRFAIDDAYEGIWEPYHLMTYGPAIEDVIERHSAQLPGCTIKELDRRPLAVSDALVLDEVHLQLRCPSRQPRPWVLNTHRGHLTQLVRRTVSRLSKR